MSASLLRAETTTEIKWVIKNQSPQLFTKDYRSQDHVTQSDMYLWIIIIGILIGIGLVLLVSWVLRTKLGYILGMLYFLMIQQTGRLSQQMPSYIYQR